MVNALRITLILAVCGCFHAWKSQNDYYVSVHRITVEYYNKSYLREATGVSFKLNRRAFAYNLSLVPQIALTKSLKLKLKAQAFKKLDTQYRLKIVDLVLDLCNAADRNFYQIAAFKLPDGSAAKCPFAPDIRLAAYNQNFDGGAFPPNMPAGSYKLLTEFVDKAPFLTISYYGDVIYKDKL